MQAIESSRVVGAWEQGRLQHPLHRALTLLQIGEPEQTVDSLALLSVGERDRRLVSLRQRLFGSSFDAVDRCPGCGERLEFSFAIEQLPMLASPVETVDVATADRRVAVRLPSTADLLAVASAPSHAQPAALLARCAGEAITGELAAIVQAKMQELDPMAQINLDLSCPACEHRWTGLFDILAYLWTELGDHVLRLFREVGALARRYGWSERDILHMTSARRQMYLEMAGA